MLNSALSGIGVKIETAWSRLVRSDVLVVAAIQTEPRLGDVVGNVDTALLHVENAFADGVRLAVLPELASSGYMFSGISEALDAAEPVPGGRACSAWARVCADYDSYLVAGVLENDRGNLYNTAVLLGPDGLIGKYRKVHLWAREHSLYRPGDLGFPVFETAIGRIGVVICYDLWFPESMRCLAVQGADIVCIPANWVPVPGQPDSWPVMANMMVMAGSHSNLVHTIAADRVGRERGQKFIGRSVIASPDGWPLAGPASDDAVEILMAQIDPVLSRKQRAHRAFNNPLKERRTEVYAHSSEQLPVGFTNASDPLITWQEG